MYHDQGQIAMKLMGFDNGVTLHGGLPVPVATCASGTAFDIVGRNVANVEGLQTGVRPRRGDRVARRIGEACTFLGHGRQAVPAREGRPARVGA